MRQIVSVPEIVCIVGGSTVNYKQIDAVFSFTNNFVAADAGADHLAAVGVVPTAVIGDLDSLSEHARATFANKICHISEQDTTDFEKAVARVDAPTVIALGVTGGRMDHMLAVLNVVARNQDRAILLLDDADVSFVAKSGQTVLRVPIGTRIGLMPLSDVQVTATGLRWPLHDSDMSPVGMISSSNASAAAQVVIDVTGPLLITLPPDCLVAALKAAARA